MTHDAIFQALSRESLVELARYISISAIVSGDPPKFFNSVSPEVQAIWLDTHRPELEDEICRVGSWTFSSVKSYAEVVRDLAQSMIVEYPSTADTPEIELAIVTKVWNDTVTKLTPAQINELKARAAEPAAKYGKGLGKEMTGFAALSAAQLSGFGVYILGSTLLGAINGALGLGLGFGAFTGLSSLIATVIGPVGWAALGLATFIKLGALNYKKLLPVVILVATQRPTISVKAMKAAEAKVTNRILTPEQEAIVLNAVAAAIKNQGQGATAPIQGEAFTPNLKKDVSPQAKLLGDMVHRKRLKISEAAVNAQDSQLAFATSMALEPTLASPGAISSEISLGVSPLCAPPSTHRLLKIRYNNWHEPTRRKSAFLPRPVPVATFDLLQFVVHGNGPGFFQRAIRKPQKCAAMLGLNLRRTPQRFFQEIILRDHRLHEFAVKDRKHLCLIFHNTGTVVIVHMMNHKIVGVWMAQSHEFNNAGSIPAIEYLLVDHVPWHFPRIVGRSLEQIQVTIPGAGQKCHSIVRLLLHSNRQ